LPAYLQNVGFSQATLARVHHTGNGIVTLALRLGHAFRGTMRAISQNTAGNVLILWAFFLIPLLGVVGSGVDIGRAYVARTHLQDACDAAALAGRRAMTASTVDAAVKAEALKFFNFNFPQFTFGTTAFTPAITSATGGAQTVVITAATTMPTTIMKLFGYTSLPVSVTCNASQDFVNTDIVLVLDTTGSMDAKANSTDPDTKIVALRSAVLPLCRQSLRHRGFAFGMASCPMRVQLTSDPL
jgi:Flp pilus assembly protein TadG